MDINYKNILNEIPISIVNISSDHKITYANSSAQDLFQTELINKNIQLNDNNLNIIKTIYDNTYSKNINIKDTININNVTYVYESILNDDNSIIVLFYKNDSIAGVNDNIYILGNMTARLAHEIKNVLSIIKMFAQLISKNNSNITLHDDEKDIKNANIIIEETDRLNLIVESILNFSKQEVYNYSNENIIDIINTITNIYIPKLDNLRINLLTSYESEKIILNIDKNKIKQILINLIENSIEAIGKDGNIAIHIITDNNYCIIKIIDDAEGIPKNMTDKIFQPFFTTKEDGIGLGLAIVKNIVDGHNGKIEINPNIPNGTECIIKIPL